MSRYVRDDKQFRAQIAKLADAGLNFPTATVNAPVDMTKLRGETQSTLQKAGFKIKDYPQQHFTPEFQRHLDRINNAKTHEEVHEAQQDALNCAMNNFKAKFGTPEQRPKGRLPELIAGLVWWSPVIAGVIVFLHWVLRGAH